MRYFNLCVEVKHCRYMAQRRAKAIRFVSLGGSDYFHTCFVGYKFKDPAFFPFDL